jgi:hypothetical protein
MNKLIDWVKSNKKKAVSAAVITLGGIAGYFVASSSGREEVFNGRVGDWNVVYQEGPKDNCLIARKGNVTVTYLDNQNPGKIDLSSKTTSPLKDTVESIVYEDRKGREVYSFDFDSSRFDADAIRKVFDDGDKHYNALREQIRVIARKDTLDRINEVDSSIK